MSTKKRSGAATLALIACTLLPSCSAGDDSSKGAEPAAADEDQPAPKPEEASSWSDELSRDTAVDWIPFARQFPKGFPQAADESADVVSGTLDSFFGPIGIQHAPGDVETLVIAQISITKSLHGARQPGVNIAIFASPTVDIDRLNELLSNGPTNVVVFLTPLTLSAGASLIDWDSQRGDLFGIAGGFLLFAVSNDGSETTVPFYPEAEFPVDVQKALADLGFAVPPIASGKGG